MPEQLDMGWEVKVPAYAVQGSEFEDGLDNRQDKGEQVTIRTWNVGT